MELILHIGGEKTGTTALQHFLHENSAALFERTRILYPTAAALCRYNAHFPVAAAFLPPGGLEFLGPSTGLPLEALKEEIKQIADRQKPEAILFSAEHFSSRMKKDEIFLLSRWFRQCGYFSRFRIVFFVRPQDELFVSALSTSLLAGRNVWNTSHVAGAGSPYFNHLAAAEMWEMHFGLKAMVVRTYGGSSSNIVADFLSSLGADFPAPAEGERRNESFGYEAMRLLYLVNRNLPDWSETSAAGQPSDHRRAAELRNRIAEVIQSSGIFRDGPPAMRALPLEARQRMRKEFAGYNTRLNEKYGINLEFRPISPGQDAKPLPADIDIMTRGLMEIARRLPKPEP